MTATNLCFKTSSLLAQKILTGVRFKILGTEPLAEVPIMHEMKAIIQKLICLQKFAWNVKGWKMDKKNRDDVSALTWSFSYLFNIVFAFHYATDNFGKFSGKTIFLINFYWMCNFKNNFENNENHRLSRTSIKYFFSIRNFNILTINYQSHPKLQISTHSNKKYANISAIYIKARNTFDYKIFQCQLLLFDFNEIENLICFIFTYIA